MLRRDGTRWLIRVGYIGTCIALKLTEKGRIVTGYLTEIAGVSTAVGAYKWGHLHSTVGDRWVVNVRFAH